ncbi:MAG: biosynthetic-type acetolactate synthase large subunit [Treponema sp.]|nr:biosynthetic-type acetolactate synthase large subunit [Treponema sp.]
MYTGARILIESLIENGVDTIFGYPGGAVLNIYDELEKNKDRIRHILVSHEQHASHAADGYARSTGRTGVCLATSGPGATNLVTGIATAFADSIPVIAITGNVGIPLLGKDSFQEVDIAGITMPVVKHNWIVKDVRSLSQIIHEAFIVALSGRPGPVLIDIPKDVSSSLCDYNEPHGNGQAFKDRAERLLKRTKQETFSEEDIEKTADMINNSGRPLIYAGGGVIHSDAAAELKKLAEHINAPVALSLMGMGAFPQEHPLCTGLTGMHGSNASNKAMQKSDLIIVIGARFSDRVTGSAGKFAHNAKIIHIDIDPAEINKNIYVNAFIAGDIKKALGRLLADKRLKNKSSGPLNEWNEEINRWKSAVPRDKPRRKTSADNKNLSPRLIIEKTAKVLGDKAIVVTDVGQHQIWVAQYYPFKNPRSFLSSGGMGTMGFGMGAAIGAKIANPQATVALFTGDGSFRMNCAEMSTLVKYSLPVLIIILNNSALGMLRQWQNSFYNSCYSQTDLENLGPDFIQLAAAYNVSGFRVTDEPELISALGKCAEIIKGGRPALIEAVIDKDEKVIPFAPGIHGAHLSFLEKK